MAVYDRPQSKGVAFGSSSAAPARDRGLTAQRRAPERGTPAQGAVVGEEETLALNF
ncbi:hypothetical protein GCM10023082_01130 [Streptomyces tremellae]|uniref:Uncharacterized protein n=1 Tax=Streptomyces tremellae TaxID=1124239 RepID=A0ABP7DKG6_9ACTN